MLLILLLVATILPTNTVVAKFDKGGIIDKLPIDDIPVEKEEAENLLDLDDCTPSSLLDLGDGISETQSLILAAESFGALLIGGSLELEKKEEPNAILETVYDFLEDGSDDSETLFWVASVRIMSMESPEFE